MLGVHECPLREFQFPEMFFLSPQENQNRVECVCHFFFGGNPFPNPLTLGRRKSLRHTQKNFPFLFPPEPEGRKKVAVASNFPQRKFEPGVKNLHAYEILFLLRHFPGRQRSRRKQTVPDLEPYGETF